MTRTSKPPRLESGDTIGIAAPASAFDREAFQKGVRRLQTAGYRTFFHEGIFSRCGYLAGNDARRAAELEELFADNRIKAVFCARGGYGSQRILPLLKSSRFSRNPTIFMGYSDITALHCYFQKACSLATFHGPLVTELGSLEEASFRFVLDSLGNNRPWGMLPTGPLTIIRPGLSEGIIAGGSLTVFASLLGTPYAPDTEGSILFFEDRGEKPYAVDRLFSHLKLAGVFAGARGLILGRFVPPAGWKAGAGAYAKELARIVHDLLGEYRFPIAADFPAGHFSASICFPLGVRVRLDADEGSVSVIEPALSVR